MRCMTALDPRVSFAELRTWPDFGGDIRYELYEGEVIQLAGAVVRHELVVSALMERLVDYKRTHGGLVFGSGLGVALSEHNYFLPDLTWIGNDRLQRIENIDDPLTFAPNLAIEVISRSTGVRDRGRKKEIFGKYGLTEYWLIEPVAKTLEIYTQNDGRLDLVGYYSGQDEVVSPTLPELRFTLDTIFVEPRSR
jgi:Uma2 family endonuclease